MSAGRPKKLTDAQKQGIIRNFVVEMGAAHLSDYNIFAQLARYANQKRFIKDVKITADDFRDKVSRNTIKTLIDSAAAGRAPKSTGSLPSYVPLDIDVLLQKSGREIKEILAGRENYFFDLYNRAATAIESFVEQEERIIILTASEKDLQNKASELMDATKKLSAENVALRKKNADLLRNAKASDAAEAQKLIEAYTTTLSEKEIINAIQTDIISPPDRKKSQKGNITKLPISFDDFI